MIFSIITKTEEILNSKRDKETKDSKRDNKETKADNTSSPIQTKESDDDSKSELSPSNIASGDPPKTSTCKFFMEGQCRFGDKCKNKHPGVKTDQLVSKTESMQQQQAKAENTNNQTGGGTEDKSNQKENSSLITGNKNTKQDMKSKGNSTVLNEFNSEDKNTSQKRIEKNKKQERHSSNTPKGGEQELTKKPSMKTATDVIHRILWDDALPTEDFVIGYLDRFIGIIEKPFGAFSWEDIASVDLNVLAVPKHRIQYFKFQGVIVWDKSKRLDNMFGSTVSGGQVLTIMDVMQKMEKKKVGDGGDDNDESASNTNFFIDGSVVKDVGIVVDVNNKSNNKSNNKNNNNNNNNNIERNRPNHFLCIRITDDAIKKHVRKVSLSFFNSSIFELIYHVDVCFDSKPSNRYPKI